ncbi:MAG: hypothetical protein PQJ46_09165 [Spirochaetales bacterium]|nr:hypothetical protein [Spirochaetales bacterium]
MAPLASGEAVPHADEQIIIDGAIAARKITIKVAAKAGAKAATSSADDIIGAAGKNFENIIDDFFKGEQPEIITNKAKDKILKSTDKKIRFDFLNEHEGSPHVHFEVLKNAKWKDAFNIHRFYPKQ